MRVKYNDAKNTKPLTEFNDPLPKKQCQDCKNKKIIAGQAYTRYECKMCEEIGRHHNTAVPKVCRKCANKLNMCEDCGSLLNKQEGK